MYSKNLSTKRINHDIKEIYKNPIEGIGIVSLENDIKKYVVNIMLLTGPYKDYCLQLLLTFPDEYPINPPKILIYPDQLFDNLYHRHIFNDDNKDENGKCFKKLCLDLLDNDFMSTKSENTGWNPSYTISTLLMQLQIFLANPDMSEKSMPKPYQIKELMESMNNYQRKFIIKDGNKEIIKTHTWKVPYPKMYFQQKELTNTINNPISEGKNKIIKENLTCFISKISFFDDHNIILGYPIVKENSGDIYPIPEILSYEGYLTQISNKKSEYDSLKSANNKYYSNWLPIYINKYNFEKNKQTILNSFSVIKFGICGEKKFDFKPEYINEIMLKIFNQMICHMKGQKISSSYLIAFFQYILLYKKLDELYTNDNQIDELCLFDFFKIDKLISKLRKIMIFSLFEKFTLLVKNLNNLKVEMKNNLALLFFLENKNCDLKSPKKFLEYLEENHLFNSIFEIMRFERNLFLYNGKNLKKIIKNIICNSFKNFIFYCDKDTKNNLKKSILKNMKFFNFINFNQLLDERLDEKTEENTKTILDYFTILLFIKKKINEPNFFNQLENNFGIYLQIDETIEKLNEIINNIDLYGEKEIDYINKSFRDNIQNIIKELFILSNNIQKISSKNLFDFMFLDSNFVGLSEIESPFSLFIFKRFRNFRMRSRYFFSSIDDIENYKKDSDSFYQLENMDLNNLKLLYLYTFQRLKKSINPDNKNLSFIESMFIKCSLNNNKNGCEWYNYISKRQNIDFEILEELFKKRDMLCQKQIINLFFEAKQINKELLSKDEIIESRLKGKKHYFLNGFSKTFFFVKVIIKNIITFAEIISENKYNFNDFKAKILNFGHVFSFENYDVKIDHSLIKKLKEIYDSGDITLLTFYEFIWFEEKYEICNGFLSALKNNAMYNFRMRNSIDLIKNHEKSNEKRIKMRFAKKIPKSINNNKITFCSKKSAIQKIFKPYKVRKSIYFKSNFGKANRSQKTYK